MQSSGLVALTLAYVVSLTLTACVTRIRPTPPNLPVTPVGEPAPSTIGVTMSVPVKPLLGEAEASLSSSQSAREYVEFFGTGGPNRPSCGIACGYDVQRSALSFLAHENEVTTNLSFSYWLSCTKRIPCKGRLVSGSCGKDEPRRRGTESLTTLIKLLPDWSANATTKDNGVVAQDQCVMGRLGAVDFVAKLAAGFSGLSKAIDGNLNRGLSQFRPKAESAWVQLSSPIRVDADTWLELKPEKVSLSAIQTAGDKLQLAGVLTVHPMVVMGGRPPAAENPLPSATSDAMSTARLEVYVPVKAAYAVVDAGLKERMKITSGGVHYPPTGKYYLRTTDVTLYAYGQKAVLRVAFTGQSEGYVYLVGTPTFDSNTNLLSFPDLDYSPDTRKLALESLEWVNQEAMIQDLRTRLVVDLAGPLNFAKSKLLDALNRRYGDVQLAGAVPTLTLVSVYADPNQGQFVAYFNMGGAVTATVQ